MSSQEHLITFQNFLGSSAVSPQSFQKTPDRTPLQTLRHPETHACSYRGQNTQTQTRQCSLWHPVHSKCCVNRNLSTRSHQRAATHSLVTNHAGGEKRVCFLWKYVTSFKMDQLNLHQLRQSFGHLSDKDSGTKWHADSNDAQCSLHINLY